MNCRGPLFGVYVRFSFFGFRFQLRPVFSVEEFAHALLPRPMVVDTFVVPVRGMNGVGAKGEVGFWVLKMGFCFPIPGRLGPHHRFF